MSTNTYRISSEEGAMNSQNLTFRDGAQQWISELPQGVDSTRDVAINTDTSLEKFFERPIILTGYTWTPGGSVYFTTIDPWTTFFQNKRVVNRIANFNLLTAKLNVKIILNGNPFYYGRLMADYRVLPGLDAVTDFASGQDQLVAASQRLHAYLDPATSEGCHLKLPFIYGRDTLSIPKSEWSKLGRLHIREVNPLKHANGSTAPVTFSVAIWAEDVKLSVPTTRNPSTIVSQVKDEYSSSPISNTATTVAAKMNMVRDIPMIGSYAKATADMVSMLGSAAKLFGYSRPAMIDDAVQMRNMPIGPLANTDRGDSVTKLTLDSKQELSIDPKVFGISASDEMVISSIASKESFLVNFPFTTAQTADSLLWNCRVTPNIGRVNGATSAYYLPACQYAALPFKYWRGTMKYRFQIVASAYHRGRIKIIYDPVFVNSAVEAAETNLTYTRIVDLENERDFTIEVSWANPSHYLPVNGLAAGSANYSTTIYSSESLDANGVLAVYVMNTLTAPNSTVNNDIRINVSVSMCDDVEFASFTDDNLANLTFSPVPTAIFNTSIENQAGDEPGEEDNTNAPTAEYTDEQIQHCFVPDNTNDVYFGERIVSFRQLLKRYVFSSYVKLVGTTNTGSYVDIKDFPPWRGEYAGAPTQSSGAGTPGYNFCTMTLLNYLSPSFVGYKGGLRSKFVFTADAPLNKSLAFLQRRNDIAAFTGMNSTSFAADFTTAGKAARSYLNVANGANGAMVTDLGTQNTLEVETPYYLPLRFDSTRGPLQNTFGGCAQSSIMMVSNTPPNAGIFRYISVGEDFQLFLFQGVPPLYIRSPPGAV